MRRRGAGSIGRMTLVAALAGALPAGAVIGGMEVQVKQSGEPVPGATISLTQEGSTVAEEEADAAGVVRIPAEDGRYSLHVDDGETSRTREVTVTGGRLDTYEVGPEGVESVDEPIPGSHVPADASAAEGFGFSYRVEAGLITMELLTPHGILYLSAPERVEPETTVTWGLTPSPAGDSEKKREKNRKRIGRYDLTVEDETVPVGPTESLRVPAGSRASIALSRKDETVAEGSVLFRVVADGAPEGDPREAFRPAPEVPAVLAGGALTFRGRFDGDVESTRIRIDGKPIRVVAESTLGASIYTPQSIGPTRVAIAEDDEDEGSETTFRNLGLRIQAEETRLSKGERTKCSVIVEGLDEVDERMILFLVNRTPGIVQLRPFDAKTLLIDPESVNPDGIYRHECTLRGIRPGNFQLTATLVPFS